MDRDSLRASVFDAFVELGILDDNRAISDLLFEDSQSTPERPSSTSDIEDDTDDIDNADTQTIHGGVSDEPTSAPSTPSKSLRRPSKFSLITSRFSPRKSSRKVSQDTVTDEGYVSSASSAKRSPRPRARLRKQSTKPVAGTVSTSASGKDGAGSFFRRQQKADTHRAIHSDSEWEWEVLSRPSMDVDVGAPSDPQPSGDTPNEQPLRRPQSLRIIPPTHVPTRSNSLPSSPFLLVIPQFPSSQDTPSDPPTPDALMRQYARRTLNSTSTSARKSANSADDDASLPRPMSFHGPSSPSVSPRASRHLSLLRTASHPPPSLRSVSQHNRQIPFPTKARSGSSIISDNSIRRVPSQETSDGL